MRQHPFALVRLLVAGLALAVVLPALAAEPAPEDKAVFTVRLPAKAVLTIDEVGTRSTGGERTFISPSLAPGKLYAYTLVATWDENGEPRSKTQKIWVRPGEHAQFDLTADAVVTREPEKKEPEKKEPEKKEPEAQAKSRTFLFTYAATVTGLKPEQEARVWLPVPPTNDDQEVKIESDKGLPEGYKIGEEKQYGNKILYFEGKADKDGNLPLSVTYRVTRREVKGAKEDPATDEQLARFLEPDKLVPIEGKPLDLLKDKKLPSDPTAAAQVMYDAVNGHMKYGKPEGKKWGNGDSVYACEEGVGNCTDFHSLFISLARSQKIPAKFEIGFPIPEKRGGGDIPGYHCWAKFNVKGKGWVPVDISEANKNPKMKDYYFGNLTEDRVAFSTGRDLTLEPKQDGPARNYLIYPYVEVDGKEYPASKIQKKFSYADEK